MDTPLDGILSTLHQNGVIKLSNIFTQNQITNLSSIYTQSWEEITIHWPNKWYNIQFHDTSTLKYDYFMGVKLYEGKKQAFYKETPILNMGLNRFDFTYNLDTIKLQCTLPTILTNIMNHMLGPEWEYYYGGLPVLPDTLDTQKQHGFWHRDAYSLFNDEMLDISLPPFYYTILIPLQPLDEKTGGGTEFILGSHKQTITDKSITNEYELQTYLAELTIQHPDKSFSPNLNPGDVIIFSGYTIHRGLLSNYYNTRRDMLYIVCKRKWYNDEPTSNYTLLEHIEQTEN
jgi:hypothetical protein